MDNVTHTLFALTLARTRLGRAGRGATAALVIASNAPDIDIVAAVGGSMNYLKWHRGPTHGPLGVIGLGFLTAVIVWSADRWFRSSRRKSGEIAAPFRALVALSLLAVLLHVAMDFPTSYGTRLLSPFDWRWFAVDWLPIIDIYLLIALAAGLLFGQMTPEIQKHNVAIALVLMCGNYALRGAAHERAVALAPRLFGPTLPQPCDSSRATTSPIGRWPRETVDSDSSRRCLVELAAVPTFLSPFRWQVIAHLSNSYELHDVDVLDRRFLSEPPASEVLWRTSIRVPNQWTPAVIEAARAPTARTFLGFSRFPDARIVVDPAGVTTVRWTDMRFGGGVAPANQPPRRLAPFTITSQVGPDNRVLVDRMER